MDKKYTEEDILELQKIHRDNYKNIHNLVRNIFDNTSDKLIRTNLMKIMEYAYQQEVFCQKDICISEKEKKRSVRPANRNTSI